MNRKAWLKGLQERERKLEREAIKAEIKAVDARIEAAGLRFDRLAEERAMLVGRL